MKNFSRLLKKSAIAVFTATIFITSAIAVQADWIQDILTNNALYYDNTNDWVGIGTTTPLASLHAKSSDR